MENKNKSGNMFVFGIIGLIFIVFGIILFSSAQGTTITTIVAVVDCLFGIALIMGALTTGKNDEAEEDEAEQDSFAQPEAQEAPARNRLYVSQTAPRKDYFSDFGDDLDLEDDTPSDPMDLAAREGELRIAAKRAADEATRAKKTATAAVQEAKQAEERLRRAEEALARLEPAEQRAAMRKIDMLAQDAAEKSEIAVNEAKRAKLAIRNAREAAELHSAAMDAAAAALSVDDEFAEFD